MSSSAEAQVAVAFPGMSLYEIIGLPKSSKKQEITSACDALTNAYRPYSNTAESEYSTGDAEKFQAILIAHYVLTNKNTKLRRLYNETGVIHDSVRAKDLQGWYAYYTKHFLRNGADCSECSFPILTVGQKLLLQPMKSNLPEPGVAKLLYDYIDSSPTKSIFMDKVSPPWDVQSFYALNPTVAITMKVKRFVERRHKMFAQEVVGRFTIIKIIPRVGTEADSANQKAIPSCDHVEKDDHDFRPPPPPTATASKTGKYRAPGSTDALSSLFQRQLHRREIDEGTELARKVSEALAESKSAKLPYSHLW